MTIEHPISPLLDATICEQLIMLERSSPGFLRRLVSGFLIRQSKAIADAEMHLQRHDHAAVRAIAHTLKGSASSLGATALAGLAGELEAAALLQDSKRCIALMEALRPSFDDVDQALRAWVGL